MKNILVVGSSHVGAIKLGIDEVTSPGEFNFTYFALPGLRFLGFRVLDRNIVAPESEYEFLHHRYGHTSVSLEDYESILYVDGPSRMSLSLYSNNRRVSLLSHAAIDEISKNFSSGLFNSLKSIVEPAKLYYLGCPLISSSSDNKNHLKNLPLLKTPEDISRSIKLSSMVRRICDKTIDDENSVSILLPPSRMLNKSQFNTLDNYMQKDFGHANSSYGREIAPHLLNCLG